MNPCTRNRTLSFLFISAAAMLSACRRDRTESGPPTPADRSSRTEDGYS